MRFFCDPLPNEGESSVLSEEIRRHVRVLRLQRGDTIELFCEGQACRATIVELDEELRVQVLTKEHAAPETAAPITLVQALPKAKKLDSIVRMAVEIGVDNIRLVTSERTIPTWPARRAQDKLGRLQRIVQEAARQSNQSRVPHVYAPEPLLQVARAIGEPATRILFWEVSAAPLSETLPARATWVAIGPEGGWSQGEAHTLRECGWVDASLPTGILRVETAAPVALALVRDRLSKATAD